MRAACSSTKEPVPAAQILFIWKSATSPPCREIYFESCPPISKTVSASGTQTLAPGAGDAHAADGEGAVFVLQGVQPFAREAPPSGSPAVRRYKKSTSVLLSAARSESRVQGICAAQAAPMAAVWRAVSGTISSSASRWNTSRMARMTPALQVTPPVKTTGLWTGRLRTIVAL